MFLDTVFWVLGTPPRSVMLIFLDISDLDWVLDLRLVKFASKFSRVALWEF